MTRGTVAVSRMIVLTACLGSFGAPALAEDPPAKPAEPKIQTPEQKPPESKTPPKAQEHKNGPESKSPESKTPEPKPTEPKAPESKAPEPKTSDQKPPESKTPEPKKEEPKTPATKQTDKAPDTKPPELKPAVPPILPIKLAFMSDPRVFPYDITVEMSGDAADLSGKVSTEEEKAAAGEIAKGIEGVKSVKNNLEVVKDLARAMARKRDDIIVQYLKDRFGKSKTLDSAHFDVKSDDGIVTLAGKTKFLVIVLEAAETARQVPGVKAVKTDAIRVEATE